MVKLHGYSKRELSFLTLAHGLALQSECNQRVGAVVVKGGSVLAKATNRDHNHPKVLEEDKVRYHSSICAERRALAKLSRASAKGSTVFVVRAARLDDGPAKSKPCDRCVSVMDELGVRKVVYVD